MPPNKRHPRKGNERRRKPRPSASGTWRKSADALRLHDLGGGAFELVLPRCAEERADDLAQAREIIAAGEPEVAREELLWLLEDCRDLIPAHVLLGRLARDAGNLAVAQAHFGYAFEAGLRALSRDFAGRLSEQRPGNAAFLAAGYELACVLLERDRRDEALDVLETLVRLVPDETLGARDLLGRFP